MIELVGWEDGAFRDTKVLGKIPFWFKDDDGMTNGIFTVLVDIRIEGCKVVVIHRLLNPGLMIELDGIRSSSAESITRVKWGNNVELIDKVTYSWIVLFELSPLTFPHLLHIVTTTC